MPRPDPRFISTVQAMEASLCDRPFMRRCETADDFGRPEVAFTVCSFWRVDALARIGRKDEARAAFEALRARRNPVGLLSEDLDTMTGGKEGPPRRPVRTRPDRMPPRHDSSACMKYEIRPESSTSSTA